MAYGKIKADTLVYDNSGSDVEVTLQSLTTKLGSSDIGSTVQAHDADTAKLDVVQSYTAIQNFNNGVTLDGSYTQAVEAVPGTNVIDLAYGNYFTKTITANTVFTFSNPHPSYATAFTLELTHTSGTVTWPASVKFPLDTAPTLTAGKTHLFVFVTDDGGTRYRGAALADYVN